MKPDGGATNCVCCARVEPGRRVYILNEAGAAETAIADAIAAAVEAPGYGLRGHTWRIIAGAARSIN